MTLQDRISILMTFVIGIFVGGYLYLTGFAPTYKLPEVDNVDVYKNFVLTGDSYGECEQNNTCLSFQLLNDGKYRAIYDSTGVKYADEGRITSALHREIPVAFTAPLLYTQALDNVDGSCYYGYDSTNFRFTVSYNDTVYTLDTCGSDIDYAGPTWAFLKKMVNFLAAKSG